MPPLDAGHPAADSYNRTGSTFLMPPLSKPHFLDPADITHAEWDVSLSSSLLFLGGSDRRRKESVMRVAIEIENIDELRRCNGIDDIELHEAIDRLRVGDHVLLTFLSGGNLRTTVPVRITRIRAGRFRGRLAAPIAQPELLGLRANALVAFTAGQIHSIARPQPEYARGKNKRGS
jgi:hypothetical protein